RDAEPGLRGEALCSGAGGRAERSEDGVARGERGERAAAGGEEFSASVVTEHRRSPSVPGDGWFRGKIGRDRRRAQARGPHGSGASVASCERWWTAVSRCDGVETRPHRDNAPAPALA